MSILLMLVWGLQVSASSEGGLEAECPNLEQFHGVQGLAMIQGGHSIFRRAAPTPKPDASVTPATNATAANDSSTQGSEPNSTAATTVNGTESAPGVNETLCATRKDPRVGNWLILGTIEASPDGTLCVFGVDGDARDEGSHCVFEDGKFGSNGWCYTSKDRSSWGSCNEHCPLYGDSANLGNKLEKVNKVVGAIAGKLGVTTEEPGKPSGAEDAKPSGANDAKPSGADDSKSSGTKDVKPSMIQMIAEGLGLMQMIQRRAPGASSTTTAAPNAPEGASANATSNDAQSGSGEKITGDTNGTAPALSNTTDSLSANGTSCATRHDPRISAWFAAASPEGTPCVFGVDGDPRDEGSHCVYDGGQYGSNGWCYTSKDRSSWGSCNEHCPLYGNSAKLGKSIEKVNAIVGDIAGKLGVATEGNSTSAVGNVSPHGAAKSSGAKDAAPDAAKGSKPSSAKDAEPFGAKASKPSMIQIIAEGLGLMQFGDVQAPTTTVAPSPTGSQAKHGTSSDAAGAATENGANDTAPAESNETTTSSTVNATGCVTRHDPRISAWFAAASPDGTACVFGVDGDPRDEGSHCVYDNGEYGSNGWCYTSKDRSSWGSCNEHCPLYGSSGKLGRAIDTVAKAVGAIAGKLGVAKSVVPGKASGANDTQPAKKSGKLHEAQALAMLFAMPPGM